MTSTEDVSGAPIRVGIIGFGNAGRLIHAPLLASTPGFRVAAVASSRGDAVRAVLPDVTIHSAVPDLLASPDIDLVIVASPPDSHARWALAALAAGKHLLVEKPFTITEAEARAIADAASSNMRVAAVFHNRRYDSCFRSIRAGITSGVLGRINHFESQYNRFDPVVMADWQSPELRGTGAWYDLGSHLVDQAIQLFGIPEAISLTQASNRPGCVVDDWFHAVLQFPTLRAVLHASFLVAGGVPRFVVHGDQGSLVKQEADRQGHQLWAGLSPAAPDYGRDEDLPLLITPDGQRYTQSASSGDYRRFFAALGAAIRGTGPNPVPIQEAVAVMAVLEAGIRSARDRRTVGILPERVAS